MARHDGKILIRSADYKVLDGPDDYGRHLIAEFPSLEAAEACFNSEEYQKARADRIPKGPRRQRRRRGAGHHRLPITGAAARGTIDTGGGTGLCAPERGGKRSVADRAQDVKPVHDSRRIRTR